MVTTQAELRFLESASRFFSEQNNKQIDWEQRRYEIARDMFTATHFGGNATSPMKWQEENPDKAKKMAKYAVIYADALIAELKK